jgi:myo-inositol-1(or 4)-monophosphatase
VTKNFARGIAHYAIAMAYVSSGWIEIGTIYTVEADELYLATRGNGTTRSGQAHWRATATESASVEIGWSNRLPNWPYVDMVATTLEAWVNVRRVSSGCAGVGVRRGWLCRVTYGRLGLSCWTSNL